MNARFAPGERVRIARRDPEYAEACGFSSDELS